MKKTKDLTPRFGIGEWFGELLTQMDTAERRYFASEVLKEKETPREQPCPFQARKQDAKCTKEGGVCSLRLYSYKADEKTGRARGAVAGPQGELRATCPYRFHEELYVFHWVGETILGDSNPKLVEEVGFLEGAQQPMPKAAMMLAGSIWCSSATSR